MKKILVPCDFSAPAQEAFKFAVTLAEQSKGELHVLHIVDLTFLNGGPSLAHSYAFNLNFLKEMEKDAEENFRTMREQYAPLSVPVTFTHKLGTLVQDIGSYIREYNMDLVVMGTHGKSGASRGSNTEKVVRTSPVPVFAIRTAPARLIKKIVVPVLPDEPHKGFTEEIKKLQAFFDADLYLVWINTPLGFKPDHQSHENLKRYGRDFNFDRYIVTVRSDYSIETGIFRYAKEIDADMIAMGTHAWKGFVHMLTGSVAEDLVNHVDLPIWTVAMK